MVSWTGLYGNMTFNQTRHHLYSTQLDDIKFGDGLEENTTTRFTITNHFCKVLEIYPSMIATKIGILLQGNDSFVIFVNDPANSNDLLFTQKSGDQIIYDSMEGKKSLIFLINLKEIQDTTGGESCTEYPNKPYQSFAQCCKDDILNTTRSIFGFNLPFFSESYQAMKPMQRLEKYEPTLNWLQSLAIDAIGGILYEPEACLHPCTILTATPKKKQQYSFRERWVTLFFN